MGYRIGADNKKLEAFVEKILVFANFVMWLKKEGIYEEVRKEVTESGYNWDEEIDNLHVAEGLRSALIKIKPNVFTSADICNQILLN